MAFISMSMIIKIKFITNFKDIKSSDFYCDGLNFMEPLG